MEEYAPVSAELVLSTVAVPHWASAVSARNTNGMMRKKNRLNNLNVRHNRSTDLSTGSGCSSVHGELVEPSRRSPPAILFNSPLEKGDTINSPLIKGEQPPKSPLTKGDTGGCPLGALCPFDKLRTSFTQPA